MPLALRVILLTGDGRRHRYAATRLASCAKLVGLVSEAKSPATAMPQLLPPADQAVIDRHFAERDEVEHRLLGAAVEFPETEVLPLPTGSVNTPEVLDWVSKRSPDLVILYGSSIIKPPLLDCYAGRMINLHLGLSPYYRGSGTNFWPLVNREPECVGATIHLAVRSVDAGAILAQIRPVAKVTDRAHELGTKTIIAGFDVMPHVLSLYIAGRIQPRPQHLSQGRTFRQKDFTAQAVATMWRHFEAGMIAEFLADAKRRCQRFPIIEIPASLR